jgi:hypothetical protein
MLDLQAELDQLTPGAIISPWPDHEHVRGYGVFGLPLASGHTLALRVFPISDFGPYITVWHRDPAGAWSIYYHASRPDVACPRYYGAAARHIARATIDLEWRGGAELLIRIDRPRLEWTVRMHAPPVLRWLNGVSRRLPLWTWQHELLLKPRAWIARGLKMGTLNLAGTMPSGHYGILMPQQLYFISHSFVTLDGRDLGRPARVRPNPHIGGVTLPARGIFAIGQAHWHIRDAEEYRRTRAELGLQ